MGCDGNQLFVTSSVLLSGIWNFKNSNFWKSHFLIQNKEKKRLGTGRWDDMMWKWFNEMWSDVVWWDLSGARAVQCSTVQCSAVVPTAHWHVLESAVVVGSEVCCCRSSGCLLISLPLHASHCHFLYYSTFSLFSLLRTALLFLWYVDLQVVGVPWVDNWYLASDLLGNKILNGLCLIPSVSLNGTE